jgi:glycosyltransferase involved in cell wall biosynthesis
LTAIASTTAIPDAPAPARPLRVAILTETFSPKMGYIGNMLPRHLARLGADVHLIALDLAPYHHLPDFQQTYGSFSAEGLPPAGTVADHDGYTLRVLPHRRALGYVRAVGLEGALRAVRPDVVQTFAAIGWLPLQAALLQRRFGYCLFTGSHTTASIFPLAQRPARPWDPALWRSRMTRALPGRLVSRVTERCYGATADCADVAVRFFGVEREKIAVAPLGVDLDVFHPVRSPADAAARGERRRRLGVGEHEILCIYTGRFADDKDPLLLARAVAALRAAGKPYRAVFLGDGAQRDALAAIDGSVVHPFVPFDELGDWFRAADVGVWPTQESTSMIDAAACGIPIVVNDTLRATERIEGNGVTYRLGDAADLARVLGTLGSSAVRESLGATGARRMAELFGWPALAARRLADYRAALGRSGGRGR